MIAFDEVDLAWFWNGVDVDLGLLQLFGPGPLISCRVLDQFRAITF